jgi:hypothetical protein
LQVLKIGSAQFGPEWIDRPVDLHIGVLLHAGVTHGGDHEASDVLSVTERLDLAQRLVGVVEGQAEHRIEAAAGFRQHLLGQPAIVGPAQLDLHFLLRMQADAQHPGREQAGVVDRHRVHPAMTELDIAVVAGLVGLLGRAHGITRHAAAHVLVADVGVHHAAAAALSQRRQAELPEYVVLHVGDELAEVLVLVVMRVDIDDENVVELAPDRLLAGMRQQAAGVQLLDWDASAAIRNQIHDVSPGESISCLEPSAFSVRSSFATFRARTLQGWRRATSRSPSTSRRSD